VAGEGVLDRGVPPAAEHAPHLLLLRPSTPPVCCCAVPLLLSVGAAAIGRVRCAVLVCGKPRARKRAVDYVEESFDCLE